MSFLIPRACHVRHLAAVLTPRVSRRRFGTRSLDRIGWGWMRHLFVGGDRARAARGVDFYVMVLLAPCFSAPNWPSWNIPDASRCFQMRGSAQTSRERPVGRRPAHAPARTSSCSIPTRNRAPPALPRRQAEHACLPPAPFATSQAIRTQHGLGGRARLRHPLRSPRLLFAPLWRT